MRTAVFSPRNFLFEPALWDFDRDFLNLAGINREASTANFKETDKAFLFALDVPGVNKQGLDIQVEGDHIVIQAVRKSKFAEDGDAESVTKTVSIPKEADRENIQAHCEDGVLYLALPKAAQARPKKIEVGEGAGEAWNKLID